MSCMMPFIFCAPCDTPIANTRNGTRIENGSSSKPSSATRPSCQTTATSEQAIDQRRAAHAARVGVDDRGGDQRGDAEERHHLDQAVDQLADQLGEADDVDLDLRRLLAARPCSTACASSYLARIFSSSTLRQAVVVDALAGAGLLVEQRHEDHARLEVVGDQAADDARARDVLLQLLDALRASRRRRRASPGRRGSLPRSPRSSAPPASTATSPTRGRRRA